MKLCFAEVKYISITIDIWSDRTLRGYIGITAHYIDHMFKFKSDVLACNNITTSHTAVNIKNDLNSVLEKFKIRYLLKFFVFFR